MKPIWIPVGVLSLLLTLSLVNGGVIDGFTGRWIDQVVQAEEAAAAGRWDEAEDLLSALYDDWSHKQTYLHIVEIHEALNQSETALQCALACIPEQDETEFRCETRELITQFRILAEMEQFNWKNIL